MLMFFTEVKGWPTNGHNYPQCPDWTTIMTPQTQLPAWAIQRVATILESQNREGAQLNSAVDLARRSGLSKNLARRCLNHLQNVPSRPVR